jgi:hypothetical protein
MIIRASGLVTFLNISYLNSRSGIFLIVSCLVYPTVLNMEAIRSSETSVNFYRAISFTSETMVLLLQRGLQEINSMRSSSIKLNNVEPRSLATEQLIFRPS